MGSTGDRAASLTIGEREDRTWGRAVSSASCGLPPSANPITNEALDATATDAVRTAAVRARFSINLATDAYNPVQWPIVNKVQSSGEN
jgi:hypothetical protein